MTFRSSRKKYLLEFKLSITICTVVGRPYEVTVDKGKVYFFSVVTFSIASHTHHGKETETTSVMTYPGEVATACLVLLKERQKL